MWICNRCQASNKDGHSQCMQCSAPRNARRFGAGTPVEAPSVQQATGPQRRMQPPPAPAPAEQQGMPPPPLRRQGTLPVAPPPLPAKTAGGFVRLVGLLLAILLPLVVVLLSVLKLSDLKPVLVEFFFGKAPALAPVATQVADAAADAVPAVTSSSPGLLHTLLGWLIYVAGTFLAVLLALVPGLSLWSLGHLGRNIRKR